MYLLILYKPILLDRINLISTIFLFYIAVTAMLTSTYFSNGIAELSIAHEISTQ